jgi:Zn-dependent protease with chaperone function
MLKTVHTGSIVLLVWIVCGWVLPAYAQFEDQHDVKFIVSALEAPIPTDVVEEARAIDDQLMSTGAIDGIKFYLVTDNRSRRVNALVRKLLVAMGQEDREWVVRVIDTQPPTTNAFVAGGKYIYVYTGLIKEASSEEELAFVLAHELGHSLLKHNSRRQQDTTNILTGIAEMIAAIAGKKAYQDVTSVTKAVRASYGQIDEEEADALAVSILWRAGLDPLRGADFFTRAARQANEEQERVTQLLEQNRREAEEYQALCQKWANTINNDYRYRTQANINTMNTICDDAEQKRLGYNLMLAESRVVKIDQELAAFYNTHPNSQNRVAAIAMLTDYMHGRRGLKSLQQFQQGYRVMSALKQTDSVLMKPPEKKAAKPKLNVSQPRRSERPLAEQLQQLKNAFEQGLITEEEYNIKRQYLLERF